MTPREKAQARQRELHGAPWGVGNIKTLEERTSEASRDGIPVGWHPVSLIAYTDGNQVVILDGGDIYLDDYEYRCDETAHNCDAMGCRWSHVIDRFKVESDVMIRGVKERMG